MSESFNILNARVLEFVEKFAQCESDTKDIPFLNLSGLPLLESAPLRGLLLPQGLELSSLYRLNLSNCALTSLDLTSVTLPNLKILFASNNQITSFPDLRTCSSLYMVAFKSNNMQTITSAEYIPNTVGWLILTDNLLQLLPDNFGHCLPNLKKVMLANNRLTHIPTSMFQCNELELIRLSNNCLRLNDFYDNGIGKDNSGDYEPEQVPHVNPVLYASHHDHLNQSPKPLLAHIALAGNESYTVTPSNDHIPWVYIDDLQVLEELGKGASGIVHRVKWCPLDGDGTVREVAMKSFHSTGNSDGSPEQELAILLALPISPYLVQTYAKVRSSNDAHDDKVIAVLMELIPPSYEILGSPPNFHTVTRDTNVGYHNNFTIDFIYAVCRDLCAVLKDLHAEQISHGDIYAHNILCDGKTIKLTDFGAGMKYDQFLSNIGDTSKDSSNNDVSINVFERIEMVAFGRFIDDFLQQVDLVDLSTENVEYNAAMRLEHIRQLAEGRKGNGQDSFATLLDYFERSDPLY